MRKVLVLALLLLGLAFHAKPAEAQSTCTGSPSCIQLQDDDQFMGTSNTVTMTGVTAGHSFHILSCAWMGAGTTPVIASATLNSSATGVQIGTPSTGAPSGGNNFTCAAIAMANATSGSNTVVVNYTGGTGTCVECFAFVEEWAGDATSSILDVSAAAYVAGPGAAPCAVTTTNAHDLVETWLYTLQFSTPTSFPAGFTTANNSAGAAGYYSAYDLVSSTGTYTANWVSGAITFDMYSVCAAFKQTGGGSPVPTKSQLLMGFGQ